MKLTIAKEDLNTALRRVQGAVAGRTTLPVLSTALIRAAGERVEFTATNLNLQITHSVKATVANDGDVCLPLSRFTSFVSELGPQEVGLESDAKFKAKITSGGAVCHVSGVNPEDFPKLQTVDAKPFTIAQQALKSAIRRTIFAASDDSTRFTLNGAFLQINAGQLTVVATDGRRVAIVTAAVEADDMEAILPTRACAELTRLLDDEGDVKISLGQNAAKFEIGDTVLVSKIIEGNYPNFKQVVPGDCKERVTVSREELRSVLRLANSATDEKSVSVRLALSRHSLRAEGSGSDTSASNSMAVNYAGVDFEMAVSGEYILEVVNALTDDEVHLEFTDPLAPLVVKASEFLCVLAPMRMN
jgi:DNA polymerase III subunit beta